MSKITIKSWSSNLYPPSELVALICKFVKFKEGNVLDIGCANGSITNMLYNYGFIPTGIEPDTNAYNIAINNLKGKNIKLLNITLDDFISDKNYKLVVAWGITPLGIIENIQKKLKMLNSEIIICNYRSNNNSYINFEKNINIKENIYLINHNHHFNNLLYKNFNISDIQIEGYKLIHLEKRTHIREFSTLKQYSNLDFPYTEEWYDCVYFKHSLFDDLNPKILFCFNNDFNLEKDLTNIKFTDYIKYIEEYDSEAILKWHDKIFIHKFFKNKNYQHHIIHTSKNFDENITEILEDKKTFVIKPSFCAYSVGTILIKNNKIIPLNQQSYSKWINKERIVSFNQWLSVSKLANNIIYNKNLDEDISLEDIKEEIKNYKKLDVENTKASTAIKIRKGNTKKGFIIEELIDSNLEIRYYVVWGKVMHITIDWNSDDFLSNNNCDLDNLHYNENGVPYDKNSPKLPMWWNEGRHFAEQIAEDALCDFVRIDVLYNNHPYLLEFTWATFPRVDDKINNMIFEKIKSGYKFRKNYVI